MKAFRFPLDRALHIRRAQLEIEQAKLQRLIGDREQLEAKATGIRNEASTARYLIATQRLLAPGEISTLPDYQRGAKQLLQIMELQKLDILKKIKDQQRQTLEAERRVKLLEKLREKRFADWEMQAQKEQEDFASDAYLARWTGSQ